MQIKRPVAALVLVLGLTALTCQAQAATPSVAAPPPAIQTPAVPPPPLITVPIRSRPGAAVPLFDLAYLITAKDYPAEARRKPVTTVITFMADVGADGRVTGCRVAWAAPVKLLGGTTCALFTQRARFDPAVDAAGQPVVGSYMAQFTWEPARLKDTPLPGTITHAFEVAVDGQVSNCRITRVTGAVARQYKVGPERCRYTEFLPDYRPVESRKRRRVTEVETIVVELVPVLVPLQP